MRTTPRITALFIYPFCLSLFYFYWVSSIFPLSKGQALADEGQEVDSWLYQESLFRPFPNRKISQLRRASCRGEYGSFLIMDLGGKSPSSLHLHLTGRGDYVNTTPLLFQENWPQAGDFFLGATLSEDFEQKPHQAALSVSYPSQGGLVFSLDQQKDLPDAGMTLVYFRQSTGVNYSQYMDCHFN